VFNGVGEPIDGGPPIAVSRLLRIEGLPLNPVARARPRDFIETGVTAVDLMNSLVRGQKLPIFSGGGLPHDRIAVGIANHARLRGDAGQDFVIVFAGIGVPYTSAEYFRRSLEASGALERSVLFLNLASDSSTQRLLTPRFALTAAEYLAFVEGKEGQGPGVGLQQRPADDGAGGILDGFDEGHRLCGEQLGLRRLGGGHGKMPPSKGSPATANEPKQTQITREGSVCLPSSGSALVVHLLADALFGLAAGQLLAEIQPEIDRGRDATRGDDVPLVNDPAIHDG